MLVPYFDKPATFLYVAHENPHLEMVFLLDVDEFLDCSDDIDVILSGHREYSSVDGTWMHDISLIVNIITITTCRNARPASSDSNDYDLR